MPPKSILPGLTEDIKGQVYNEETGLKASQFITTTNEVASYSGLTCTDPQDMRTAIGNLDDVEFKIPEKK